MAAEIADVSTGRPLISVVVPVFDAEAFLDESIRSVIDQTYGDFELILLVDGGSSDASAAIAEAWSHRDERVRLIMHAHMPAAASRLMGVREARGTFIAFQDADDRSDPRRFEMQLAHMEHDDLAICGCQVEKFGQVSGVIWFPEDHRGVLYEQLFRFGLFTPALMMRRAVMLELGEPGPRFFEDFAWWNELVHRHRSGNTAEILYRWRQHADNSSTLRRGELLAEYRAGRRALLAAIFPGADDADRQALDVLATDDPGTPEALERAGQWASRLVEGLGPGARRRMEQRWRDCCARAAGMGPVVWRIYRRYRVADAEDSRYRLKLFILTRLRMGINSAPYRSIASVVRRLRGRGRASNPAHPLSG